MPEQQFEVLRPGRSAGGRIKAAVFDFDGTFSTLRCGWEQVMEPLMLEMISGGPAEQADEALREEVRAYIDASTGIQTVYQMQWLRDRVEKEGRGSAQRDEWWYKAEYNRRLMEQVSVRLKRLEDGLDRPESYLIRGAVDFLLALKRCGVEVYLASGTDHCDVTREAKALGVDRFFTAIKGAPEHMAACSKEAVIRMILEEKGLPGDELLLVGDGKVEIALGAAAGAYTIGAATDEKARHGKNPVKCARLKAAGADVLTGDFSELNAIMSWLGFEPAFRPDTSGLIEDFAERHPEFADHRAGIEAAISLFADTFRSGHKLLVCGNGGSCADGDHIVGELLKGFLLKRPLPEGRKARFREMLGEDGTRIAGALQGGLPAISLNAHRAAMSAFANDVDAEFVYAQQVAAYGQPGDLLLGISTSGNAKNVSAAVKTARVLGLRTMGLTGRDGGMLARDTDLSLIAPEQETYRIQECHLALYHLLCGATEYELFGN